MQTASKKVINGWAMYDWANSVYSLVITSTLFPAYFTAIAPREIELFGRTYYRDSLASYSIAISFLIIAFLSPILSSIADYKGNKKAFMKFFCYTGSIACCLLFFFTENNIGFGLLLSMVAMIGYCGSIVFYNAYLPEIAAEEDQDRISAKGFSMGYIGSVILMVLCLTVITLDEKMGWGFGSWPVRISFIAVGLWWAGFAQITFSRLPDSKGSDEHAEHSIFTNGFYELKKVWNQLQHYPKLKRFLRSFFFYNMGVQTVMYMAPYFAQDELKMESGQLILTILIIQLVAILGAYLFSLVSKKTSNILALGCIIILWIAICIFAFLTKTANEFYLVAFGVGMVMGGVQSMSRSTYSKLLPETKDTASYFSFYDVCDKLGTVIGTLSFGYVAEIFNGMRNSVLALMLYFIIGLILLLFVNMKSKFKPV